MKKILLCSFFMVLLNSKTQVFAQAGNELQKDSTVIMKKLSKQGQTLLQQRFYKQSLGIDSLAAIRVDHIHMEYRQAMALLFKDNSRSIQEREKDAFRLMAERNKKLSAVLTQEQLDKIIPPPERGL